jgi:hypothetical protein
MKKRYLVLFLFAFANNFYAQDTIKFVDKPVLSVKVNEVGINEIKYHRFDNLDGPTYLANKKDIEYIKYENGQVDSFNVTKSVSVSSPEPIVVSRPNPNNEKIIIAGTKLIHFGKPLGESRLYRLVNNYPNEQKKSLLLKEYYVMKNYKKKQYLFGFVGLGAGALLAYVGTGIGLVFNEPVPVIVGWSLGVTVGVTGAIISGINKSKRLKKKVDIANLYNN